MSSSGTKQRATALVLPPDLREQLETWARAGHPLEACGLLVGRTYGESTRVELVRQGRNLSEERARDRYDLDPLDHLSIENEARRLGLDVVGVWHSHPDHPARPSETDRERAWEGWSYLILSVTSAGVADARSWRLCGTRFVEESLIP